MESWDESVWGLVEMIPAGRVATYGQLAILLGRPRHARHVGHALRVTPDALAIPWHRVVNGRGQISFQPSSHQYRLQRALLESEGVHFDGDDRIPLKAYRWLP